MSDDALRDLIRYYTREAGFVALSVSWPVWLAKRPNILIEGLKTVRVTPRTLAKYADRKFSRCSR
ncbi:hypothetical protein [Thalassospira alkalitolerans]|uniref:hypothetical protein n=1 Tax=Thalassospira alkalitolerans TaxID=1293890 RepID=UPI003AA7BBE1